MITEIELLKQDIPRLEKKFGRDNAFVELLRAQLAFLQNQTVHHSQSEQRHLGVVGFLKTQIEKRKSASKK